MDTTALRGRNVLVVGEYRQTVTVVRSLHRAGMRITFASPDSDSPTRRSRGVRRWVKLEETTAERFCEQLEARLRGDPHEFVFLVGESPLRRFLARSATLEPLAIWVQPSADAIRTCFDKSALYGLLARTTVPVLPWAQVTGAEECRASAARIGFPLVVKNLDSSATVRGRKALICRGPAELEEFLAAPGCERGQQPLVMQKFQPGVRHNCHVAAADGRLLAYFQQKVLSTTEPDVQKRCSTAASITQSCAGLRSGLPAVTPPAEFTPPEATKSLKLSWSTSRSMRRRSWVVSRAAQLTARRGFR